MTLEHLNGNVWRLHIGRFSVDWWPRYLGWFHGRARGDNGSVIVGVYVTALCWHGTSAR